MSEFSSDPAPREELTSLESALRGLAPRPIALDRDTVLFRAGKAAAGRAWPWKFATAISSAAAVVLGVMLVLRPAPKVVEHIVRIPAPASPAPETSSEKPSVPDTTEPTDAEETPSYQTPRRRLEENLLRWGLDGLPTREPDPEPPARSNNALFHPLSSIGE